MPKLSSLALALAAASYACAASNPVLLRRTVSYSSESVLTCKTSHITREGYADATRWLDVWAERGDEVDIRVSDAEQEASVRTAFGQGACNTAIADLEGLVAREQSRINARRRQGARAQADDEWFEDYHTYEEIVQWYENVVRNNTQIASLGSIGESLEGRDQPFFSLQGTGGSSEKPVIYMQCQIHAREWISGATCMFIVDYLVQNYGSDPRVTKILDELNLIVVPFVNPDGYSYTWSNERLWRKNRRPAPQGSNCMGVDLNRNYDDQWGGAGGSSNPCSETYFGTGPASEVEVQNTMNFFRSLNQVHGAIDVHSYSQLMLRPLSWTSADARDEAVLAKIGDGVRDIVGEMYGTRYVSGKWFNDLYPSTGVGSDWFYSEDATRTNNGKRAAGYTLELRPQNPQGGGFILPPEQIIPNGEEVVPAILFFMEELTEGIDA